MIIWETFWGQGEWSFEMDWVGVYGVCLWRSLRISFRNDVSTQLILPCGREIIKWSFLHRYFLGITVLSYKLQFKGHYMIVQYYPVCSFYSTSLSLRLFKTVILNSVVYDTWATEAKFTIAQTLASFTQESMRIMKSVGSEDNGKKMRVFWCDVHLIHI